MISFVSATSQSGKCKRQMYTLSRYRERRTTLLGGVCCGGLVRWAVFLAHSPIIGCSVGVVERKSRTILLLRWSVYLRNGVDTSPYRAVPWEGLGNEGSRTIGVVYATNQFFHRGPPSVKAPFTQYLPVDEADTAVSHHTCQVLHVEGLE